MASNNSTNKFFLNKIIITPNNSHNSSSNINFNILIESFLIFKK